MNRLLLKLVLAFSTAVIVLAVAVDYWQTLMGANASSSATSIHTLDQSGQTSEATGSTLITSAPFQSNQVAGAIATWPHYSDAIIDVPYPPNWHYQISYRENSSDSYEQFSDSSHLIETISFSERAGAIHDSDGALIEVDKNPISVAEELSNPGLMSESGLTPPTEYRIPNKSYPAVAYEFNDYESEYMANVDMACGGDIMHALIDLIPGEEPRLQSSTLVLHAMINGLKMKQCEDASSTGG